MLVIHLNNGKWIRTDQAFDDLSKDIEDCNLGFVRVYRHVEFLQDTAVDVSYGERKLIDTVIDKNEIAFIDILE